MELFDNKENKHPYRDLREECFKWIKLLFNVVSVTDENAHLHLQKFLAPNEGSIVNDEECRSYIISQVVEKAKYSFPKLSIEMFFSLYKSLNIWPNAVSLSYHPPIYSCMHCPFYLFSTIIHSSIYLFQSLSIHPSIYSISTPLFILPSVLHPSIHFFI